MPRATSFFITSNGGARPGSPKDEIFREIHATSGCVLKCQSGRTITSFVNSMAGGLIREQFNRYIFFFRIFQQINHITMISDRTRLSTLHRLIYDTERFNYTIGNMPYPSLFVTGFDTRSIHFGNDTGGSGNFRRFGLCPLIPPKPEETNKCPRKSLS